MTLLTRFDEDLKRAMKASESTKVSVLRMLKSALKNRQIEEGRELTDDEIIKVVSTLVKRGRDSIEQFSKAGRADLAKKEEDEIAVLQSYMPEQLGSEELDRIIVESIRESSAKTAQDMGKVMRILMPKIKGIADGKYVNNRVKELLESAGGAIAASETEGPL
ncbi:MAG: GatB/YqeY domain-containing protein [Nitrospirota bacterium]